MAQHLAMQLESSREPWWDTHSLGCAVLCCACCRTVTLQGLHCSAGTSKAAHPDNKVTRASVRGEHTAGSSTVQCKLLVWAAELQIRSVHASAKCRGCRFHLQPALCNPTNLSGLQGSSGRTWFEEGIAILPSNLLYELHLLPQALPAVPQLSPRTCLALHPARATDSGVLVGETKKPNKTTKMSH